jgi:N-methylhydantoinase A
MTYTVGIDVGGTFTDLLLLDDETGAKTPHKTSTTPANPADGVMTGLHDLAQIAGLDAASFFSEIDLIVHGTTVATNAVLTGNGARTGLITTEGFRDILEMRRGIRSRKHLYDNKYVAPAPLATRELRATVVERVDVAGEIVTPLDEDSLVAAIQQLRDRQVEAVAICFMQSYRNNGHEQRAKEVVRKLLPDVFLSVSSEVLPQVRLYPRVSTTVMNSYLGPVVERYMRNLVGQLDEAQFAGTLMIMQSNGGIAKPEGVAEVPASIAMSGPAAGPVAGLAYVAARGLQDCTVVDMGGTSFDASLVKDGEVQVTREGEINRHMISLPTTHVHTIGAGGGSIGWIDDGGLLQMGPKSAGADPGPAAYGRGGTEPTTTDADVVLGYIDPDYFLGGRMVLRRDLAEEAIRTRLAEPLGLSVEEAAAGMYEMVNLAMASGTKNVSVEAGYDPREFPMVVAGGAGPVHSGMIAHELDIPVLFIPKMSSVICAAGMLMADLRHDFVRGFNAMLSTLDLSVATSLIEEMSVEGHELLDDEGAPPDARDIVVSADLRYVGQHHEIILSFPTRDFADHEGRGRIAAAFHRRHEELFGFANPQADVEMLSLRVTAVGRRPGFPLGDSNDPGGVLDDALKGRRGVYLRSEARKVEVPIYDGDRLPVGQVAEGPCVIEEPQTTIFVPEFFDIILDASGSYVMYRKGRSLDELDTLGTLEGSR